jgi:hypothetical protein
MTKHSPLKAYISWGTKLHTHIKEQVKLYSSLEEIGRAHVW